MAHTLRLVGDIQNKGLHEGEKKLPEKQLRQCLEKMKTLILGKEGKLGLIVQLYELFAKKTRPIGRWIPSKTWLD